MRRAFIGITFGIALVTPLRCHAQAAPTVPAPQMIVNDGDAIFVPVSHLRQDLLQPRIGNGSTADPSQWPATVVMLAGGMGKCTGTFVGPEVLLTAAHCVGQGAKAIVVDWETTGVCHRQSDWLFGVNMSPDWALCRMKPVSRSGLFFERLNLNDDAVKVGARLMLAGFGCVDLDRENWKEENPPVLRVGSAIVERLPNLDASWANWIVTVPATHGGASFVCPGDSGGAVYRQSASGVRSIIGVVSAVGADKDKPDYKASYVSALSTPALKAFVTKWHQDQSVAPSTSPAICGMTVDATRCRPNPP